MYYVEYNIIKISDIICRLQDMTLNIYIFYEREIAFIHTIYPDKVESLSWKGRVFHMNSLPNKVK